VVYSGDLPIRGASASYSFGTHWVWIYIFPHSHGHHSFLSFPLSRPIASITHTAAVTTPAIFHLLQKFSAHKVSTPPNPHLHQHQPSSSGLQINPHTHSIPIIHLVPGTKPHSLLLPHPLQTSPSTYARTKPCKHPLLIAELVNPREDSRSIPQRYRRCKRHLGQRGVCPLLIDYPHDIDVVVDQDVISLVVQMATEEVGFFISTQ
jgi:hypothetical protein